MHARQAIRQAVIARLVGDAPTYRTVARDRVFSTRREPLRHHELPAISVYVDSEVVDEDSADTAPRELKRTATVAIEGWVQYREAVDDVLDDLALEIETAMDGDQNLAGTAFDSVLTLTEVGVRLEGERPLACVHLEYAVTYHTQPQLAEPVDPFDVAGVEHDPAGVVSDLVTGINQEE